MFFTATRILSFLLVLFYRNHFSTAAEYYFFYAITMAHYVTGFLYSPKQQKGTFGATYSVLGLVAVSAALLFISFLLYRFQIPEISFYFGIHLALTDAYIIRKNLESQGKYLSERFYFLRCLGYLSVYVLIFRYHYVPILGIPLLWISAAAALIAFCCFAAAYYLDYKREHGHFAPTFDAAGLFILWVCLATVTPTTHWYHSVIYHVLFWFFIPLQKLAPAKKNRPAMGYLIWHVLLFFAFFFPVAFLSSPFENTNMMVTLLAYFHITASFFQSSLNPKFLYQNGRRYALAAETAKTG